MDNFIWAVRRMTDQIKRHVGSDWGLSDEGCTRDIPDHHLLFAHEVSGYAEQSLYYPTGGYELGLVGPHTIAEVARALVQGAWSAQRVREPLYREWAGGCPTPRHEVRRRGC
jgi:hypothetical protein